MNAVWQIIDMATGVKLNNPPMGTETYSMCLYLLRSS